MVVDAAIGPSYVGLGNVHPLGLGDANGDGNVDILLVDSASGDVGLLLGNGDGTFESPIRGQVAGTSAAAAVLAQLGMSHQGTSIIAEDQDFSSQIEFLQAQQSELTDTLPSIVRYAIDVAVADLNGDGWPDLLALGTPTAVYLGGPSGFTRAADIPGAGFDRNDVLGDFNEDGILDVMLAGQHGPELFLGNGDGTFATGMNLGTNLGFWLIGDFNGDGHLDLLTNDLSAGSSVLLLGSGDGSFTPGTYSGPAAWEVVTVADFNGDGHLDLIAWSNDLPGRFQILLGNGDGSFQPGIDLSTGEDSRHISVADVNNDQRPDLVIGHGLDGNVSILLNTCQ